MRTNFATFKSGDVVSVKKDYPYINHDVLYKKHYVINKMIDAAGVVTLKGFPYNKTFPDDAFELVEDKNEIL